MTLLRNGAPVMGIVVEMQLTPDAEKRYTWPLYTAALHARLRCPVALLVIAPDDAVARWAEAPIATLQLGSAFVPLVLGRARIPVVMSAAEASRAPELAVLSAMAHGHESAGLDIGRVAARAAASLDDQRRTSYTDLVLTALSPEARAILELEMDLRNYKFQSPTFKDQIAQAAADGEARAHARSILAVLSARGIDVPDAVRAIITATADIDRLERWVRRAATATNAEDVIRDQ